MGLGDNLMATGMARGAKARGKRIAFGDGEKIIWDHYSEQIFKGNPNIAHPGDEGADDLEWIRFYRGSRIYNTHRGERWIWNYQFRPTAGEVFFTDAELRFAEQFGSGFVLIEPNVPRFKTVARNKDWGIDNWQRLSIRLRRAGYDVRQFYYNGSSQLRDVAQIKTPDFRHALAVLRNARLFVGPEGGLHHGAAAVGIDAVVIFGGFIPPEVTGYPQHSNIASGGKACGSLRPCNHCKAALARISVQQVEAECRRLLSRAAPDISAPISASG